MDSDPRLVVFFIILSTNPKMLQMMNILVNTPLSDTTERQAERGAECQDTKYKILKF